MHALSFSEFTTYGFLLCVAMMLATRAYSQTPQHHESLPVLYGIKLDSAQLAIDVASSGCTDASYFSIHIESGIAGYIPLVDHTEQGGSVPDECACDYRNAGYASSAESGRSPIQVIKQAGDPGDTVPIEALVEVLGATAGKCAVSPLAQNITLLPGGR